MIAVASPIPLLGASLCRCRVSDLILVKMAGKDSDAEGPELALNAGAIEQAVARYESACDRFNVP